MKPTQRKQLQTELRSLEAKFEAEMRGRMVATPKAIRIRQAAQMVQAEIDRIDKAVREAVAFDGLPKEDMLEVMAIPLVADVLNDFVVTLDKRLREAGCSESKFGEYTKQIRTAAYKIMDTMSAEDCPSFLLEVNDTLTDAVKKKVKSFIKQRINITKD